MNRKEIKEFLETLHFHGYIDHDVTKLESLIDGYYPKQLQQTDISGDKVVEATDKLKNYLIGMAIEWHEEELRKLKEAINP